MKQTPKHINAALDAISCLDIHNLMKTLMMYIFRKITPNTIYVTVRVSECLKMHAWS